MTLGQGNQIHPTLRRPASLNSDKPQGHLSNSSPPQSNQEESREAASLPAHACPIELDPELIFEQILSGDREFITLLCKELSSPEATSLLSEQVWDSICQNCEKLPRAILFNLISEAHQMESSAPALALATAILMAPSHSNDVELINSLVNLLHGRNLASSSEVAELANRAYAYGEHLPDNVRKECAKPKSAPAIPEVLDHAAMACVRLQYEGAMPDRTDADVRLLGLEAQIHTLLFMRKFPNCVNPWIEMLARVAPDMLIDFYREQKKERSKLPQADDYKTAVATALLLPLIDYGLRVALGMAPRNFIFSLGFMVPAAIGALYRAGHLRRAHADKVVPPLQREQLYKAAEEILAHRENCRIARD